jgi:hypothetical protein
MSISIQTPQEQNKLHPLSHIQGCKGHLNTSLLMLLYKLVCIKVGFAYFNLLKFVTKNTSLKNFITVAHVLNCTLQKNSSPCPYNLTSLSILNLSLKPILPSNEKFVTLSEYSSTSKYGIYLNARHGLFVKFGI